MASALSYAPSIRKVNSTNMSQPLRPTTRGTIGSSTTSSNGSNQRRTSLSSFPSSRSPSVMSQRRPSRSPNPPPIDTDRRSDPSTSNSKTPTSGVSSQHSSLSAPNKSHPGAHPARKLKSQYPRGDSENHVEYILVASFDIDKGPIMEHQYPVAITGDEHMLAELMLPDQAHVRNQDWTIFFLHKDTSQDEQDAEEKAERKRLRKAKKEAKAALFESGNVDPLEEMNHSDEEESEDDEPAGGEGPPLIYVLNLVNTKQDKTAKRGAVVKAMAICTRHPFLHIYKVCHFNDGAESTDY